MALGINGAFNQVAALNNLTSGNRATSSLLRKLSSGEGVTRAADDAAALSISSALKSDKQTTDQAVKNIQTAVSILRTAEGGLGQIGTLVSRARELAVQGASSIIDPSAREGIQAEIDSIKSEISRVANVTEFNGQPLLDGSLATSSSNRTTIQAGINNSPDDQISLNFIDGASLSHLGLDALDVSSAKSAARSIDLADTALTRLGAERANVGALENRFENAATNLGISSENLLASIDALTGLDFAGEASNLANNRTLQNAATLLQKKGNNLNRLLVGQLLNTKV